MYNARRKKTSTVEQHILEDDDCGVCELLGSTKDLITTPPVSNRVKKDEKPPDIVGLGNSGWSIIHSFAAYFPRRPTDLHKTSAKQFIHSFSVLFPCKYCADDFKDYIARNPVKADTREEFCRWTCEAHNEVNVKLGKPLFDCNKFDQRWRMDRESNR